MSKKLLARLLALTLCAGLVLQPVTAYAGQEDGEADETEEIVAVAPDEEVQIIEEVDGWYKIITSDGEGYVNGEYVDSNK